MLLEKYTKKTPVQVAIAWVLAQPGIICALTGPSTIKHLKENCGGSGWRLDKDSLENINKILSREKNWLTGKQGKTLQKLLNEPLDSDPVQAFTDLIFIIETAVLHKFVDETSLFPAFIELFDLRDELNSESIPVLESIHHKLRDLIQINNNPTR
jgi:hypothetical protein